MVESYHTGERSTPHSEPACVHERLPRLNLLLLALIRPDIPLFRFLESYGLAYKVIASIDAPIHALHDVILEKIVRPIGEYDGNPDMMLGSRFEFALRSGKLLLPFVTVGSLDFSHDILIIAATVERKIALHITHLRPDFDKQE